MKKIISFLLIICISTLGFPIVAYSAIDMTSVSINEFSENLTELNEQYKDEPVSNRLIVKSKYDINELNSVDIIEGYEDLHIVQFDNSESAEEALEYYSDSKLVEYAEQDFSMSTTEIDYKPHLSWGSESMGTDDYFAYFEDVDNLPEIVVGVIDTGIELDHEFLRDRIIQTGVNFSDSGEIDSENDDNGHGTHCAGIIVDNTLDNVKIEGFKVLSDKGSGSMSNVISGIYSAINNNVDIISMSLGGKGHSEAMQDAVDTALSKGITVCAGAGNDGTKAENFCPANLDGVIAVAAHDAYDNMPMWSNFGDTVDIIAPGVAIESSWLGNTYETHSGTSMACPHAAAAAALILSKHNNYSATDILNVFQSNGRNVENQFYEGKKILYIGDINNYRERTVMPEFITKPDIYEEQVDIELTCNDENADIYYTIDGTIPTLENSTLYTEPIHIDNSSVIKAFAYNRSKMKSILLMGEFFIGTADSDDNYEIDENGVITAYNGSSKYLKIPETIKGITVTGIGYRVFYRSQIARVFLPDTLKSIGEQAFKYCSNIEKIDCKNVEYFGVEAFRGCDHLKAVETNGEFSLDAAAFKSCIVLSHIDFHSIKELGQQTFYNCYVIDGGYNNKIETIPKQAFHNCNGILYLELPNLISVKEGGISNCILLETIKANKLKSVDDSAFENDTSIKELDFPELSILNGRMQFYNLFSVTRINLPKISGKLPDYCFSSIHNVDELVLNRITEIGSNSIIRSDIGKVVLKNVEIINDNAFLNSNFDTLYLPKLNSVGNGLNCVKSLDILFVPSLIDAGSLPFKSNETKIYLSNKFVNCENFDANYKFGTIIAPKGSYAESLTKKETTNDATNFENNLTFVDSDTMVAAKGASIRPKDCGLRFGFSWDEIQKLSEFADNVEYGFEYAYGETENLNKTKKATNRVYHPENNNTTFNLVFTGVPKTSFETVISARAYVNIDGMIFKSPILHRSFNGVANAALNDDTLDESIKEHIRQVLEA